MHFGWEKRLPYVCVGQSLRNAQCAPFGLPRVSKTAVEIAPVQTIRQKTALGGKTAKATAERTRDSGIYESWVSAMGTTLYCDRRGKPMALFD
jgi:hypothetical protein